MKLHIVSARNGEVVGFTNRADATWTATGKHRPVWQPSLGAQFREDHSESKTFPMISIELTPEQVKALRIPKEQSGGTVVCG